MKRYDEFITPFDLLSWLPVDLFNVIHQELPPQSKAALTLTDKHKHLLCSQVAKEICFLPPNHSSAPPKDIYPALLARYPNIRKLTLLSHRNNCKTNNATQIHNLIKFLNFQKDRLPLSHIKELDIQEMKLPCALVHCSKQDLKDHSHLNQNLLRALSHPQLESVIWRTFRKSTRLTCEDIQPILDKAISLKHFQTMGIFNRPQHTLSFKIQTQLQSIILSPSIYVDHQTISSLKNSLNLKILNATYSCRNNDENAWNQIPWNLKQLTLSIPINLINIAFIEKMPLLEHLTILNGFPTINSLKLPNLRELRIERLNLSEDSIATLMLELKELEVFIFQGEYPAVEKVWTAIQSNCPKIDSCLSDLTKQPWNCWIFYNSANGIPNFN